MSGHGWRKRKNNQPKPRCWYGEHPIHGKVKVWGDHKVCPKCYKILCKKFMTGKNLLKKIQRANNSQGKGFFARLFGW